MLITKLEYQKRNPDRINMYIDGKFFCGISVDTLARESLYEGLSVDSNMLDSIVQKELHNRFFSRVVEYISRNPRTEFQVYRYLRDLRFKKKNIWYKEDIQVEWDSMFDSIVSRLKELKYINDEEFAHLFVQSRVRNRPRGKSVLISELLSKGVDKETAQRVCDEEIEDEYDVLKRVFDKKFKGRKFNNRDNKMIGFLLRKGFSWDLIERLKNDTEE